MLRTGVDIVEIERVARAVSNHGGRFLARVFTEDELTYCCGDARRLAARFAPTHRLRQIGRKLDDSGLPGWMENLSDLDRLLALWEWRAAPTPWLWMEKR